MLSLPLSHASLSEELLTFGYQIRNILLIEELTLATRDQVFLFSENKVTRLDAVPTVGSATTSEIRVGGEKIGEISISRSLSAIDSLVFSALAEKFALALEARKLRGEKNFLLNILDNIDEGVVACDETGTLRLFNKKTRSFHGLTEQALTSEHWSRSYDLFYRDGTTPLNEKDIPLFRAFQGNAFKNYNFVIHPKGGSPLKMVADGFPIFDHSGKKIGAVSTMRDESEISLQLKKAELRFQTLFEQAPLSIQICSSDGRTLLVNPAWKKLWGISDEVIQNVVLKDYNLLTDTVLEEQGVTHYIREGFKGNTVRVPVIRYDAQQNGLDGKVKMVEGLIYPLKDPSGNVSEIVIVHTDVSEKEELLRRQNFLAGLTSILITTLDYKEIISRIAEACVEELSDGCMIDLVEDGKIRRLVTRHRDPRIKALMDELQQNFPPTLDSPQPTGRVMRTGAPEILRVVDREVIISHCLNEKHAKLITEIGINSNIAVPIFIKGKIRGAINLLHTTNRPGFNDADLETAVEVARRASLAIENSQLFQEAQEAILKRDEFISIASHELKTPITSMKLQLQLAGKIASPANTMIESNSIRKITDISIRQINRITVLVEDMLDIARMTTGKLSLNLQMNNISSMAHEVLTRLGSETPDFDKLISSEIEEDVVTLCDSFRIEQVITNLLINAIRYGEKKPIKMVLKKESGMIVIKIIDEGPGIDPKDQERIFQRFERAANPGSVSGMGLGLFISRQIIEQHGGTLTLESRPGEGATFIAAFPA